MSAFFDVPTGQQPEGVLLLDPATGLPVTPAATGLTNAQLRASPLSTTDTLNGTRQYNPDAIARQPVGAASARVTLPTLGASREIYVMGSVRQFFRTGDSSVTVAAGTGHPLAADERFHLRVPPGHTHIAYIRDSADGFISIVGVA